jgi:polyhydroxyalkanoate synthesis regulator phasin
VRAVEEDAEAATRRDVHALRAQLDRIEARLAALDELAQRDRHTSGLP